MRRGFWSYIDGLEAQSRYLGRFDGLRTALAALDSRLERAGIAATSRRVYNQNEKLVAYRNPGAGERHTSCEDCGQTHLWQEGESCTGCGSQSFVMGDYATAIRFEVARCAICARIYKVDEEECHRDPIWHATLTDQQITEANL